MGVITFDEYNKKRKQNIQSSNNKQSSTTILFNDYQKKYGINNEISKITRVGNSYLLPTKTTNTNKNEYIDTGKKYGDYWYQEYATRKDDKIYTKNDKFYVFNNRTGQYQNVDNIHYMTSKEADEKSLKEAEKSGYKGNKSALAHISDQLKLDTSNLTKEEYKIYTEDLLRQQQQRDEQLKRKREVHYSGTGFDALGDIKYSTQKIGNKINDEIILPVKNFDENYEVGQKNNELAIEYYKKMQGKKNKVEKLEHEINTYNRFNQDLINNPGASGQAIQNLNTQIESLKGQTIASGVLGTIGGVGGFIIGGPTGAIAGAKGGVALGYALGGTPYTYKLEAGNQYKTLLEMGVPEKIAKDAAQKTGAINVAIESGENIIDIVTLGQAGKITSKATQEVYDQLVKEYGRNNLKKFVVSSGIKYLQNISSESFEEMAQEGVSIKYEKNALETAGIERETTRAEDINRILEAGESAAISTAFTSPITSIGGTIATNVTNSIQKHTTTRIEINEKIKNEILTVEQSTGNKLTKSEINNIKKVVNDNLKQKNIIITESNNKMPTVEDIVAQENAKKAEDVVSNDMMSNDINAQGDTSVAFSDNNIAHSNESVNETIANNETTSKYTNITEAINDYANNIKNNFNSNIKIEQKKNIPIDYTTQSQKSIFNKAKELFSNIGKKTFVNNDESIIVVTNEDIKESIAKTVRNTEQKKLLAEHMEVFSNLDKIIENGERISSGPETKNRSQYQSWDYYVTPIYINGEKYIVQFDTVLRTDGEKHFRLERIYRLNEIIKKQATPTGLPIDNQLTSRFVEQPVSDNNIPQINNNVKLPVISNNNTQNIASNTNNINSLEKTAPPMKNHQSKNNKKSNKSKQIAKILNETMQNDYLTVKQRRWIETSLESDPVKDKVLIDDLDEKKITYVVQSNKKTLNKANNKLSSMGYDTAIKYIQSQINSNDITLTDVALAERLIQEAIKKGDNQLAGELLVDTAIIGTELGQKVQALSMIQRLTPEGQLLMYQRLVQRAKAKGDTSFQNVEITPEMVDLILNAYNQDGTFNQDDLNSRVEQFKEKVAEQLITTTSEKTVTWRYLSMLGNPKTHIRNVVSNIAMWGTLKVKNATARTIETIAPIKNKTKTWKKASKEVNDFAKITTQEMKNVIIGESKYNEKTSIESKKQIFKNKKLEKLKNFNSKMLSGEDWLFSRTAFENTLKEYLTAQGIETNADINNNSEIVEKAKLYALEQAEIATFRQYSWLANQISKIENKNFATKLAVGSTIPFKKTPINIAKAGVSYSPIGLLKSVSYDAYQVSQGNMEASQFIDNVSQGLTGTSLALIGYALAKAGLLKGAGDDDKEGKYDSYLGNQTYSIRIGDSTYSISWLSPVAIPLLVGATAYEKLEEQAEWDMNIIMDTLAQTLDPLSEMSFLSSLDDVLSSYDSGMKKFTGMAESMTQNYITQFIPTLFSQIANTLDDKKRTTRASNNSSWKFGEETVRKVMYKIPIARNQLEASTDIWGNEIEQSDNILERAFESFIAPYSKKKDISTELDSELKRLYNVTGETGVIPGVPKGFIKYEDVTYQLSADEYTQLKKTYGTTANKYLQLLVKNKTYKNATDEEKANMVKEIFEYASVISKEEYFKDKDIEYTNDTLKKVNKFRELGMNTNQLTEYVSNQKVISTIKNNKNLTTQDKKSKISNLLIDANLNDKQLAFLYGSYYSSEEMLNNMIKANIPIKEFIKFNSREFTTDYYTNGKAVPNSRRNKVIKYINSLNLSIPQKALLIKMEYSSYDKYDKQIVSYINKQSLSKFEKASLLKSFGFDSYDKYLISYVNKMSITKREKEEMLKEMGFSIRNGRVYS